MKKIKPNVHSPNKMNSSRSVLLVIVTAFSLVLLSYLYLSTRYNATAKDDFIGHNEENITDILDYHFIATNFALGGQFPLSGYLLDTSAYKIRADEDTRLTFLEVYRQYGSVTNLARPPLYLLVVGSMYKIFGYKIYYNQRLNIILLSLIIGFMPVIGFVNWRIKGYLTGLIAAIIFLTYGCQRFYIYTMDIEVFMTFTVFLVFCLGSIALANHKWIYNLLFGLSIGISLLTKPILIFLPLILAAYAVFGNNERRAAIMRTAIAFLGIGLVVLPWTLYINLHYAKVKNQSDTWAAHVLSGIKPVELNNWKNLDCTGKDHILCLDMMTYFSKIMMTKHTQAAGPIIITSVPAIGVLMANNEYSLDGQQMHGEWIFLKTSFYRSHDHGQCAARQLISFYKDHPSYLLLIPLSRLRISTNDGLPFFWFSGALWALCILLGRCISIKKKKTKSWAIGSIIVAVIIISLFEVLKYYAVIVWTVLFFAGLIFFRSDGKAISGKIFPMLWLGIFLFILLIMGEPRFIRIMLPISLLWSTYYLFFLLESFLKMIGSSRHTDQPQNE